MLDLGKKEITWYCLPECSPRRGQSCVHAPSRTRTSSGHSGDLLQTLLFTSSFVQTTRFVYYVLDTVLHETRN
jgi:hypothetical protein